MDRKTYVKNYISKWNPILGLSSIKMPKHPAILFDTCASVIDLAEVLVSAAGAARGLPPPFDRIVHSVPRIRPDRRLPRQRGRRQADQQEERRPQPHYPQGAQFGKEYVL